MKRTLLCLITLLMVFCFVGCSEKANSSKVSTDTTNGIATESSETEISLTTESSAEIVESKKIPSDNVTTDNSTEEDNSISGIVKSKFSEWGVEIQDYTREGESGIFGNYYSEETNDIIDFSYIHFNNSKDAKNCFDMAIKDGEIYDVIDDKIENLTSEPRKQIMSGHFQYDENSPVQPDFYVLIQYGNEYFYMYGRGEEQVDRVKELAEALDLDIS